MMNPFEVAGTRSNYRKWFTNAMFLGNTAAPSAHHIISFCSHEMMVER
jgi:hypothetical protein